MQKKPSTKSIIIIIAIVVIAIIGYFYFSGSPKSDSTLTTEDAPPSELTNKTTQIITLLNQTSSLKIDTALFKSAVYMSLVDHTVPVVEQPVGKTNPFLYNAPPPPPVKK